MPPASKSKSSSFKNKTSKAPEQKIPNQIFEITASIKIAVKSHAGKIEIQKEIKKFLNQNLDDYLSTCKGETGFNSHIFLDDQIQVQVQKIPEA